MSNIVLTSGQELAFKGTMGWYAKQNDQLLRIGGYAGTGKSFLTSYIVSELIRSSDLWSNEIAYCTFTGKASLVIRRYNPNARNVGTVHSLIYHYDGEKDGDLVYKLREDLGRVKLIVFDEGSMMTTDLLRDLMSFGKPILVLGDPCQLGAVGDDARLMVDPDYMLTEIMRQALDNPIVYLSMLARERKRIELGSYGGKVTVMRKNDPRLTAEVMLRSDQVICGYNKTRDRLNKQMRNALEFYGDPKTGDKIVFTSNNRLNEVEGVSIVNGMTGYIVSDVSRVRDPLYGTSYFEMDVRADFLTESYGGILVPATDFDPSNRESYVKASVGFERMDYGYAITTYKAQGSQFPNVVYIDEPFGDEPWRQTYTGITRAEERLILAI